MKFSVIVPVYKAEEYLQECVKSIIDQDYNDFELILVDDGSPDKCPEICDAYAEMDKRVVVIHKPNGGASDARNAGIKIAKGEYLLFIDSDDYWSTNTVLTKVNNAIDSYGVDIVQYGQEMLYSRENRITTSEKRSLAQFNGKNTEDIIKNLVANDNFAISACSMAISRNFVINNNVYFVVGKRTEDLEWAIHLYTHEPSWAFIDEYFYVYRIQREGSVTATIDYKHLCDYCWMLEKSLEHIEKCEGIVKKSLMSYLMYQVVIAIALCYKVELSRKEKKEILYRLKIMCKDNITKYTLNKKVKLASSVYRVCGYILMTWILGFYINNRGR